MSSAYYKFSFLSVFTVSIIISLVLLSLPYKASAISPGSITIDVIPVNYAPNENVDINLSSFAANLDTVLITWFVNGRNTSSGIGKKSFSLTTGASGSDTTVMVKLDFPDGEIQKTVSIRPNVMALLWQANDSYVPPFYKGKAMPTLESEIKVVAMPEIRSRTGIVDPKNMTYAWRKDYSNEQEGSGYGKNFFLYTGDYLEGTNNIEVAASTIDGQYSSGANVDITAGSPEISFYKQDNDLGTIWEKALENGHRIQNGETIVAIPYFISPKRIQSPILNWSWFINDSLVNIQGVKKNVIPLKVEEGTSGTSKLRLEMENRGKIFQTANREIELQF